MFTGELGSSMGLVSDLLHSDPGGECVQMTLHDCFWGINTDDRDTQEERKKVL